MEGRLGSMEKWRRYFMSANTDIFEVIKNAIILAAMDSPDEFKLRRDRIAELLFSCKLTKCLRCDEVGLAVPEVEEEEEEEEEEDDEKCKSEMDGRDHSPEDDRMKKNKVNVRIDDDDDENDDDHGDGNDVEADLNHHNHHISYGEVEALTDEIEEESQMFREVLRIKEILENSKDESDSVLYNSLRRLELMDLSVEILKATEIGKSVKVLVKHGSDQIKRLAGMLLKYWVDKVDRWLNAPEAITNVSEGTPESMKKSDVVDEEEEEEGLPSPPLDVGAFFLTETAPIEWGEFFDGMDDNGNPRNSGESTKNRDNGRKPLVKNSNLDKRKQQLSHESVKPSSTEKKEHQQQQLPRQSVKPTNDRKPQQLHREPLTKPTDRTGQQPKKQETLDKKQATVVKPNKPSLGESGPGRPAKPGVEQNSNFEFKAQKRPTDRVALQKRELAFQQQNKLKNSEEAAELKLEAAKRKLQERYQEAQNAKKQRTVQVMELRDIPKQDHVQRNPHMRPGNNGRFRGNGRR